VFDDLRNRLRSQRPARLAAASGAHPIDGGPAPIRYRPLLVAQVPAEGHRLRTAMRGVLTALGRRDEDALVAGLLAFAGAFRGIGLARNVQFYPYLAWALHGTPAARTMFEAVHADAQRCLGGIEAILATYLTAPWGRDRRRRLAPDLVHVARLLGQWLRIDEEVLLPLYLPPGQYRTIGPAPPR